MLSRPLVRAAGAVTPRSALRAFSTTSQQLKVPSMADVSAAPQSVASFNEKSKQFREQLVEQQKQREASAYQPSPPPSASESAKDGISSVIATSGQKAEATQEPPRKAGPLTNLIYGTKEGRELDAQLEASFSQVLARGKYVHSIVFHEVKPDKVDEYTELVGNWYPRMASMPENKVHLVGSWRTEVGDCNTFGMSLSRSSGTTETAANISLNSPYLGVPEIPGLPRVDPQHRFPPRVRRVRQEAQKPDHLEEDISYAGVLFLAHDASPPARRRL